MDLREKSVTVDMLNGKLPMSKIAIEIGGLRSNIYRKTKRNHFKDSEISYLSGYYGLSPEKISSRLWFDDHLVRVSHKTIYSCVYSLVGQPKELVRYLPSRHNNVGYATPDRVIR